MNKVYALAVLAAVLSGCAVRSTTWKGKVEWPDEHSAKNIIPLTEAGAALAALRAVPRLHCVTDAVAAAGMPDGPYRLGAHAIEKRGDTVRLAEGGSLAGSVLTMDKALANLVALGLPLAEAASRCAALPAAYLGLEDRGRIVPGAAADLVVLDSRCRLELVLAEGRPIEGIGST